MAHYSIRFPFLTSSITTVTASTSPVEVIARNDNRGSFMLSLSGSTTAYVGFGTTPTTSSYSIFMNHGDYYEDSFGFQGNVIVVFGSSSSTTKLFATEFDRG